ncbi:MAG: TlpA family protein disulfide reductase [Sediminibacterium sp.]|nr:TlpA family protein disulfide reductase [Sediminibacterium sp.]
MLVLVNVFLISYAQADTLPHVLIKKINGTKLYASELPNKNKPVLIAFWATWCKFCIAELSAISSEYKSLQDSTGVKLVAISTDAGVTEEYIKKFAERRNWPFEIYWDYKKSLKNSMGVQEIPHLMLVDAGGRIIWQKIGFNPGDETIIFAKLSELLLTQKIIK